MAEHKIVVEIFGDQYPLKSDDDAAYVRELADLVDRTMREVAQKTHSLSASKISVLTSLQLADEYLRLKKDYEELMQLMDEK